MARLFAQPHQVKSIRAKHDEIIVTDMDFAERRLASGIVLLSDNGKSEGIRPRWGRIVAIGPKQTQFKVGQWILVAHGRWTRGAEIELDGEEMVIHRVDINEILLYSDNRPTDETMGLEGVAKKEM
jgi:co-chaperonin GroES (HSP10)